MSKRFVSIRLTEEEFQQFQANLKASTCASVTEYVRKLLLNKPLRYKVRNESLDQIYLELVKIKEILDRAVFLDAHLYLQDKEAGRQRTL